MRKAAALVSFVLLAGILRADDTVDLLQKARGLAGDGRHGEAIEVYEAALAKVEAGLGPESAAMVVLWKELAEQHSALGQWAEAEALYRRVLAVEEAAFRPDRLAVAMNLTELASLCERQGKLDEGQAVASRALGFLEAVCPEEKAAGHTKPDEACLEARRSHRELAGRLAAGGRRRVEPVTAAVASPAAESAAGGLEVYRVQLASHQDRAAAQRELERYRAAHPGLAAVPGRVESVEVGERGVWHRVQFGEFSGVTEARRLCGELRERGQACLVVSDP